MAAWYDETPGMSMNFWRGLALGLALIAAAIGGIVALVTVLGPIVNLP